jgi:dCTP deaminase
MFSGAKIKECIERGTIVIDPYDESRVNPNSYNVRLGDKIAWYTKTPLDPKKNNPTELQFIPPSGFILEPWKLYLAATVEKTHTDKFVPMFDGRSSTGRLGIFTHVTAGFGDVGFNGRWTLEIVVVERVVIYPFMEIGQVSFEPLEMTDAEILNQKPDILYRGKYQNAKGLESSKLFKEMS